MKIEEAIKYLKMATDEAGNEEFSDEYKEMCNMSIKALEKQIPKKPIELDKWGEYYECPICNKYAVDNLGCKYKFCRECGQKLDW